MKMKSEELLNDLAGLTKINMTCVAALRRNTFEELSWSKDDDSWSVLQCIEHLNLYGNFYLPEIKKSILKSRYSQETDFNSGFLGKHFAKSMLPGKNMKRVKTFKGKNPSKEGLTKDVIQEFIIQQQKMLRLLELAKKVSLNRTKVPISIAKWLKLKLGDVLRVVIYHNKRHLVQVSNILKQRFPEEDIRHIDFL